MQVICVTAPVQTGGSFCDRVPAEGYHWLICVLNEGEGLRHRPAGSQSPASPMTTAGTASQRVEATPPGPQGSPARFPPSILC